MNLSELQSEREKIAQEIEEKTRELKADLAAVDRLIARYSQNNGAPAREESAPITTRRRVRFNPEADLLSSASRVNLAALVRHAIGDIGGQPFSKNTIVEWLAKNHPLVEPNHPTISAQLWHMDQKGLLETVQERNGNKPALYRATEFFPKAA